MEGERVAQGVSVVLIFLAVIVDERNATLGRVPEIKIYPCVLGVPIGGRQDLAAVGVVAVRYLRGSGKNPLVTIRNPRITSADAYRGLVDDKVCRTRVFKEQRRAEEQTIHLCCTGALSNLQMLPAADDVPTILGGPTAVSDTGVRQIRIRGASSNDVQLRVVEKVGVGYPACEIGIPRTDLKGR